MYINVWYLLVTTITHEAVHKPYICYPMNPGHLTAQQHISLTFSKLKQIYQSILLLLWMKEEKELNFNIRLYVNTSVQLVCIMYINTCALFCAHQNTCRSRRWCRENSHSNYCIDESVWVPVNLIVLYVLFSFLRSSICTVDNSNSFFFFFSSFNNLWLKTRCAHVSSGVFWNLINKLN